MIPHPSSPAPELPSDLPRGNPAYHPSLSEHGRKLLAAIFADPASVKSAIEELVAIGIPRQSIGLAMRDFSQPSESEDQRTEEILESTQLGALGGGALGGLMGLVFGMGALFIPGIGPVIAGGLFAEALGGIGIGVAAGGVVGALVGSGFHPKEAEKLHDGIGLGHIVVTVDSGPRIREAFEILNHHGGRVTTKLPPGVGPESAVEAASEEIGTDWEEGADLIEGAGKAAPPDEKLDSKMTI